MLISFASPLLHGCGARSSLSELEQSALDPETGSADTAEPDRDVVDAPPDTVDPPPPKGWSPIADPPSGFVGRVEHVAVWTGREMLIAGGKHMVVPVGYLRDGARYDRARDVWSRIPDMPLTGRANTAFAWTGTKLFVWGGGNSVAAFADGAEFDPATDTWTTVPPPPASFRGRSDPSAAYFASTGEVVIWGGVARPNTVEVLADGAAYNVASRTWRLIAASPLRARQFHSTSASSSTVAIGFGLGASAVRWNDVAFFDAATDAWKSAPTSPLSPRLVPLSVMGDGLLVLGGTIGGAPAGADPYGDAAIYDRVLGIWESVPEPTIGDARRLYPIGFYGGGRFHFWGGRRGLPNVFGDGLAYDRTTRTWSAMPTERAPEPRYKASVVWTGEEAIVWGGLRAKTPLPIANGAAYRP